MKFKSSMFCWLLLFLLPIAVLGYAAFDYFGDLQNRASEKVDKDSASILVTSSLVYPGFVESTRGIASISSLKVDRVIEIPVSENTPVKAGAPVLILDERTSELLLQAAAANLKNAENSLTAAKQNSERYPLKIKQQEGLIDTLRASLEQAENNVSIHNKRLELRQITREEYNVAQSKVDQAFHAIQIEESKLDELKMFQTSIESDLAQIQIEQAEIGLRQAQLDLENCTLRAPEDGTVIRINSKVGELVGPTIPSIEFLPNAELIVRLQIEQIHIDRIERDAVILIRDYYHRENTWSGAIIDVSANYSRGNQSMDGRMGFSDVRVLECTSSIQGNTDSLRIGQRVWVEIEAK